MKTESIRSKEALPRIDDYLASRIKLKYALPAGFSGGAASLIVSSILFAASAPLLFNPQYQSEKVINVQSTALLVTNQGAFAAGWLVVAVVRGLAFAWLYKTIPGTGLRKGLNWGVALFLTTIIFSEFFTAFNLLGEPLYLIALELTLLLTAFIAEGSVVATIYRRAWA